MICGQLVRFLLRDGSANMPGDTEAVQAYRQLRDLIIRTDLRPGAPLVEADLMKNLSVGRTPPRCAAPSSP